MVDNKHKLPLESGEGNAKRLWIWDQLSKVSGQSVSVIVNGRYEELPESQYVAEREHARKLLEKRSRWWGC